MSGWIIKDHRFKADCASHLACDTVDSLLKLHGWITFQTPTLQGSEVMMRLLSCLFSVLLCSQFLACQAGLSVVPIACSREVDYAFALDSSGSIDSAEFEQLREFVVMFAGSYDI